MGPSDPTWSCQAPWRSSRYGDRVAHLFLSDEWLDAMEELRDERAAEFPDVPVDARINLTVRSTPFDESELCLHIDTTGGYPVLIREHVDGSELAITIDYATATGLFVDRDPEKIIKAFFEGRILVQGDVSRLMALQDIAVPDGTEERAIAVAEEVAALTAFPEA